MILKSEEIREVVLVELNRTLIANLHRLPLLDRILNDPRLHLVIDDGRRYLINSQEGFDLITTDPLRTTTACNNLYADSFFRLIATHLNPQGIWHGGTSTESCRRTLLRSSHFLRCTAFLYHVKCPSRRFTIGDCIS